MLRGSLTVGLAAAAGWLAGFLIGATVGGNLTPDVVLAGGRGYEATGPIGAIAGAVVGATLAMIAVLRRSRGRSGVA